MCFCLCVYKNTQYLLFWKLKNRQCNILRKNTASNFSTDLYIYIYVFVRTRVLCLYVCVCLRKAVKNRWIVRENRLTNEYMHVDIHTINTHNTHTRVFLCVYVCARKHKSGIDGICRRGQFALRAIAFARNRMYTALWFRPHTLLAKLVSKSGYFQFVVLDDVKDSGHPLSEGRFVLLKASN